MRIIFLFILTCSAIQMMAQDSLDYRPKIAEFSYEYLSRYNVFVRPDDQSGAISDIEKDRLLRLRLGAPIVLKQKSVFGFQFKYYYQTYGVARADGVMENDLFRHLDNNPLTNAGINFLYQRNFTEDKNLTLVGVAEIASDRWILNRYSSRYYVYGQYMKTLNNRSKIGYGGVVNYALGVLNVYPTFAYHRKLSEHMLFEANLPSNLNLRYHLSQQTHFILQTEFSNWRFNITDALESGPHLLTVQRADVYFKLKLEQEIHDWLWFGVDLGYVNNVNYFIVDPGGRIREALQKYDLKDSAYLRFSIFMVPPRKLWEAR